MSRLFVVASLFACAPAPAVQPVEVAIVASQVAPSATAVAIAPPPGSLASAEPAADPCATAFEDQLALYIDIEIKEKGVHPGWRLLFLERCQGMPLPFQRCASPLYQIGHGAECEAVKAESGTPAARQWSATFNVLQGAPPSLAGPPRLER